MIEIKNSVQINRPVEQVFDFVTNVENLPKWAGPVTEAKQTSEGPVGVGAIQTQTAQFLGRRVESSQEVTQYELNKRLSTKTTSGSFPVEVNYTFESIDGGTLIHLEGNVDAGGFFKLGEPIVGRMLRRQTDADIETLKELLEAQA